MIESSSPFPVLAIVVVVAIAALTVWAIAATIRDPQNTFEEKLIWTIVLLVFPGIALLPWAIAKLYRRSRPSTSPPV